MSTSVYIYETILTEEIRNEERINSAFINNGIIYPALQGLMGKKRNELKTKMFFLKAYL
jgi:hypothetical protein